ncbi:MAG: glycosyltransferase family 4 protein [Actinomycetota bacterium]
MRILLLAPSPARRDGIAAYAAVQAERLRGEGHQVEVLEVAPGPASLRRAARLAARFDRVIVHFQPSLYFRPRAPWSKVATAWAFLALCRRRQTEVLVHEADPPVRGRPDYRILGWAFRAAPRLWFHTRAEVESLQGDYGIRVRWALAPHAEGIRVSPSGRDAARRSLGIDPAATVFVCPGFLHPGKGFDRAIAAFRSVPGARLYVVGSVRDPISPNVAYASRLRELCAGVPGAELLEAFVTDEELDAWIAAADAVVLPYRRAWSSGMLARAQLLGTPAIVSRVGGLPEQAMEADMVFEDDAGLAGAMRAVLAANAPRSERGAR